ncbi:acetyl/propionyl/methylcrotonyl-CoA carboxylase subunit alpha [uncultured Marinobacter sp.]|uniref:acetyl/propionyl/methylcrotonyl-CoA carboxylase subunit alpha n=1 Tax=uncultured Marinobacter sp. TaxID=187379 RepID=UPI0030D6E36D
MSRQSPIQSLLIANRGEIARRIIRTARQLGVRSVAVYSDADAQAPFVKEADQAVHIGPAEAASSYLDYDKIVEAAKATGVDAIHPGYGFLSENTRFAAACEKAGIAFIGPPASAIAAMGSKSAAKALMEKAGVPLVPGYHGDEQTMERFAREAPAIGYPLLIKASAGGGGKGMRVVRNQEELAEQITGARREAESSFGDAHLLMERYLEAPRHVEVQVMFDQHGQGRYLFDRDCSVQRRHQKIIEEAPAPGIPDAIRKAMGEAAVRCGEAIGYVGAGTVEFLFDAQSDDFFFMEMNTRLQVEHPVTEMITGLDLVEWQLRVAAGEPLPWAQSELRCSGHAMEARVYAEDPGNDFLPQTGHLYRLTEPSSQGPVRVDSGVSEGLEVTPWYDPMLAKVIASGSDRDQARRNLIQALKEYHADGVTLNVDYVSRVLAHPAFASADLTTGFVENYREDLAEGPFTPEEVLALSWLGWLHTCGRSAATPVTTPSPWQLLTGFRIACSDWQPCELDVSSERTFGRYQLSGDQAARFASGDTETTLQWSGNTDGSLMVQLNGRQVRLDAHGRGNQVAIFADAMTWPARINNPEEREGAGANETELTAPMHGRVTSVLVAAGDTVVSGQALLTLEAMKMEHTLRAGFDGKVEEVLCDNGSSVVAAQVLVRLEKPEEEA